MASVGAEKAEPAPEKAGSHSFLASLRHKNFRIYVAAQVLSNVGTWIQIMAENWLVLRLSHSGLALGITSALQFGPLIVFGMYGGVVADRNSRWRLLVITQSCMGLLALLMGVLAITEVVRVWMVWIAAAALGLVKCFDLPALQSFPNDLVGKADLPNAIALTNAINATGRMIGPLLGGLIVTAFGVSPGFFINAATFLGVVLVLCSLDKSKLQQGKSVARGPGQIREALIYVRTNSILSVTALAMAIVFTAGYNFQVLIPLVASDILSGDSETYGNLMSALGGGSLVGSLIIAKYVRTGITMLAVWTLVLGGVNAIVALMHVPNLALIAVFALGVSASLFSVTTNSTLQLHTRDEMRGRVMALYSISFLGSSLIGGPLFGGLAQWLGVENALLIAAVVCSLTGVVFGLRAMTGQSRSIP